MGIKFGPAGLGPVREAVGNLEGYHKLGLTACEIAFTYGAYIKTKGDALAIRKKAKELGISLSIHAPYWINLNSADRGKLEKSKQRILRCLEIGTWLDASKVVFHPGYYGKMDKEETYENIKREIIELHNVKKQKKYTPELAPETTGKVNVFGSIDEISRLSKETGCSFCIDFAHILAREKDYKFIEVLEKFKIYDSLHIHFSGIAYSEKGERHHKKTSEKDLKEMLIVLSAKAKNKNITIINESPEPVEDSIKGMKICKYINSG